MLMAKTRNPLSDWISMMVSTDSYKMACPTFLPDSVFVATYKRSKLRLDVFLLCSLSEQPT